jgi:hypothetical protein
LETGGGGQTLAAFTHFLVEEVFEVQEEEEGVRKRAADFVV